MPTFNTVMAILQVDPPHGWDYFLTAVLAALGTMMAIVAWFIRGKIATIDKRLDKADETASAVALLSDQFESHASEDRRHFDEVREDFQAGRKTMHWLGDCMLTIGAKMDVKLPDRPQ